jgi:hypothetical protein
MLPHNSASTWCHGRETPDDYSSVGLTCRTTVDLVGDRERLAHCRRALIIGGRKIQNSEIYGQANSITFTTTFIRK